MAARLNPKHDAKTRQKIKTSQLVNRLMQHANGKNEMTVTQIRAAEILLRKTLPDLSAVTLDGDLDLTQKIVSAEPMPEDEWESKYGGLAAPAGASESTH